MPKFSIVIPLYNARDTLPMTVESVQQQSMQDWEMIIVDDCSTDGSFELALKYSEFDSRIRVLRLPANSGSAKLPRDLGIKAASCAYCLYIDSDDEISPDYLKIMSKHLETDKAEVVLPTTCFKDIIHNSVKKQLPAEGQLKGKVMKGSEACLLTLPHWQVGCAGMVFKKKLYETALVQNSGSFVYSDEFTERLILFNAESVVISSAEYIYWQHPTSITHKESSKKFEVLYVDRQLIDFASKNYGADLGHEMFSAMLSRMIVLQKVAYRNKALYSDEDNMRIQSVLHDAFVSLRQVKGVRRNLKERLWLYDETLFHLICRRRK